MIFRLPFVLGSKCFKRICSAPNRLKKKVSKRHGQHFAHCLFLIAFVSSFVWFSLRTLNDEHANDFDPFERYGVFIAIFLYFCRMIPLLALPNVLFNLAGQIRYCIFSEPVVQLSLMPPNPPHMRIRVVTRGDFPDLVKRNVSRNVSTCVSAGIPNFAVEVVTDNAISISPLSSHPTVRLREIVVPPSYKPKSGALFKARALQYCLENGVNQLDDDDWIVHLDEETVMTENAARGIFNFIVNGKAKIGQGVITYANEEIVSWITTLADLVRVAEDVGKYKFQFKNFEKPLFGMKGSYVVTQVATERAVSFDNGKDGSVAEDCYFALIASAKGVKFGFIEGEMWEKSPFSFYDFLQQRKRWIQGISLVVHSSKVPMSVKFLLALNLYVWICLPLCTSNIVLAGIAPVPLHPVVSFLLALVGAGNLYMYPCGFFRAFPVKRLGIFRAVACLCGLVLVIPMNVIVENIAVIWGIFGYKYKFYVVKKEPISQVLVQV
ncbi:unnamed protein product [Notodromas monacha]|uniref:Glycosyltransferase 2-like domain-containing protein n=1 Tax=Notodromas monacha TaxID=399045 RepID=A0A7R9GEJ6_9CRUS|nr:unnamed protein product [Notodromas monacha]CAG0919690.1 unnamed protein product [Notodromas monacha]